ncbi:hydroxyphenylacetyl-CoA thioesterase PaaI [Candidatus Thalassolituus haligoni]|uniref:hydroxyphenylacetyl-CoA thioesterase PaaI n=1 Tax=Candidatus Thalassolituus haligoni TaxID=3100113 RepID=UPI003515332D|tara:strand:- start:31361 stop:31855 length:495 start_codon:yes stop_codon:yes gene_type:complete
MTDQSHLQTMNADELAVACANELYRRDSATQHLGIELLHSSPGQSTVAMTVADFMLQGHQTCHGGYLFTLADSAFAFACNTYNEPTVAIGCAIDYVAPGRGGDVLTATAVERSRSGRTGNYDVEIHNQDGHLIALFHGKSYRVRGQILEPNTHLKPPTQENHND